MAGTAATIRWGALALAAALLLAACGGSGEGKHVRVEISPVTGGEDTQPAPAPAPGAAAIKASVEAQPAADAATAFRGHGTWWNPDQPGTGFFFEAQGDTGVVTFYVFDEAGKPVWFSGSGPFVRDGTAFAFNGVLRRFQGGQAAGSTVARTPTSTEVGAVAIRFEGESASVQVPGRSYTARKFFAGVSSRDGDSRKPETGIYWNAQQSGRGYTVEAFGGQATVAVFHYDSTGAPTWNLVVAPLQSVMPAFNTASFVAYAGGQTLGGPFTHAPTATTDGTLSVSFGSACTGQLRFPRMTQTVTLKRFGFAGLSERDTCRAWTTVAGGHEPAYNTATLPTMGTGARGNLANGDLSVTFGFALNEPQVITALADFSAKAEIALPSGLVPRWRLVSGTLPAGLTFDAATGTVRGMATEAGEAVIEVAATVDGFGGQVLDRQTFVVRPPLVSHDGYYGDDVPVVATSFEVDWFAPPRPLLVLRDPASLHPMALGPGASLAFGVAPGSSLPPGLHYDAATNTIGGTPTLRNERHETVFEARLTSGGRTTRFEGTVPFRVHATGAPASPGRIAYDTRPVVTARTDLEDQLRTQGERGFAFQANLGLPEGRTVALYARDSAETFEHQLLPAAGDSLTLQAQLSDMTVRGFRWMATVGPSYEYSGFVRGSAGGRHEMIVWHWNTSNASQLVAQSNTKGAEGYAFMTQRTFSSRLVSVQQKDTQRESRYQYQASTEDPFRQTDFLARVNAQGALGWRLRPVEIPPVNVGPGRLPPRVMVWEKDAAQRATFHYTVVPTPRTEAEFLLVAAEQGRTGGVLAASYLHLSLPGVLVFVRPLQCAGLICRAAPFMPQ